MSRENTYRGSGDVPYATRDFLGPILKICLAARAYLREKKITPTKKKCAIDQARCLASPTYPVYYLTPSELGEISIPQKKCGNLSALGELALKSKVTIFPGFDFFG